MDATSSIAQQTIVCVLLGQLAVPTGQMVVAIGEKQKQERQQQTLSTASRGPGKPAAPTGSTQDDSTAPAAQNPPDAMPQETGRVIERPMRPGIGKKLARIPLYPIIGLGKGFEKGLLLVEEHHMRQRLTYWRGWLERNHTQVLTGGMGSGTGFALGVNFFGGDPNGSRFEIPLRYSTNQYQQFEALFSFSLAGERALFFDVSGAYRSRPREDFFGLGRDSLEDNRTSYKLQDRSVGAAVGTEWRSFRLEFGARYTNAKTFRGEDTRFPSTGTLFPTLSGLADGSSQVSYGVANRFAVLDNELDPHRGIRWRGRFQWVDSLDSNNFKFYDIGAVMEGYVPLGGPRTLAVRAIGDFRRPREGGDIPFYVLPYLGGAQTMRGFREFRFYDRNAVLFNLEYRWLIWKYADFLLFVDQGQVAPRVADMTWNGFRSGYGGGLRFRAKRGIFLRFDVGRSSEGTRFYFTFSPEF